MELPDTGKKIDFAKLKAEWEKQEKGELEDNWD